MAVEQPTEASFLKDVAEHQMEVVRDDGVHRHLRFKRPGSWCYGFEVITWPGFLAYTGDMGAFVFQRLDDMLQFFRADREHRLCGDGKTLHINRGYWAEKLVAHDRNSGHTEYSKDKFIQIVREQRIEWIREARRENQLNKDRRRELWEAIDHEVLYHADDGELAAHTAARDFRFEATIEETNRRRGVWDFGDFWERNLTDYTYHFVWCCYALAWAVLKYDEAKQPGINIQLPDGATGARIYSGEPGSERLVQQIDIAALKSSN